MPPRTRKRPAASGAEDSGSTTSPKRSRNDGPSNNAANEGAFNTANAANAVNAPNAANNNTGNNGGNAELPRLPRRDRWSPVSVSGNLDTDFRNNMRNPARAREFLCYCKPSILGEDDDDDEWEDEDEDEDEKDHKKGDQKEAENGGTVEWEDVKKRCDHGRTCICDKPAAAHPDHPWCMTQAGLQLVFQCHVQSQIRCPDNFDAYTYNDHTGLGILQVLQNLLLDYDEADDDWFRQWAVCETIVEILPQDAFSPLFQIDGYDDLMVAVEMVGLLFLSMLARLEREGQLSPDSEVRDLAAVMGLYIELADFLAEVGLELEPDPDEDAPPKKNQKKDSSGKAGKAAYKYQKGTWPRLIAAYAVKHNITLTGRLPKLDEKLASGEFADLPLPPSARDPWGWKKALKKYTRDHGVSFFENGLGPVTIGGDSLDLTSWTSADRKEVSFNGKDPLGPRQRKAIRDGLVMMLG